MKKSLVLLLLAAFLISIPVQADYVAYLRELPQYSYGNGTVLTEESYPEIRIFPGYASAVFSSDADLDKPVVCFPYPEGTSPQSYTTNDASVVDLQNSILYQYQVKESDSFEEFINEAKDDSWILLDGSDGTAAWIDPDDRKAYGMIAVKELGKSAKLILTIKMDNLDTRMPINDRIKALSDTISTEAARINGSLRYEKRSPYWSTGKYVGAKLLDSGFQYLLNLDFPVFEVNFSDGTEGKSTFSATSMNSTFINGIFEFTPGYYVETEIGFMSSPYGVRMYQDHDPNAKEYTLENGSKWIVYVSGQDSDNMITAAYACKNLGIKGIGDEDLYLSVFLKGRNLRWPNIDEILNDVIEFDKYTISDPSEDVYTTEEKPVEQEATTPEDVTSEDATSEDAASEDAASEDAASEDAASEDAASQKASNEVWTCPECGTENDTNFCGQCGTAKPVSNEWTCPDCGQVNTTNFCTSCGTKKPE